MCNEENSFINALLDRIQNLVFGTARLQADILSKNILIKAKDNQIESMNKNYCIVEDSLRKEIVELKSMIAKITSEK